MKVVPLIVEKQLTLNDCQNTEEEKGIPLPQNFLSRSAQTGNSKPMCHQKVQTKNKNKKQKQNQNIFQKEESRHDKELIQEGCGASYQFFSLSNDTISSCCYDKCVGKFIQRICQNPRHIQKICFVISSNQKSLTWMRFSNRK